MHDFECLVREDSRLKDWRINMNTNQYRSGTINMNHTCYIGVIIASNKSNAPGLRAIKNFTVFSITDRRPHLILKGICIQSLLDMLVWPQRINTLQHTTCQRLFYGFISIFFVIL